VGERVNDTCVIGADINRVWNVITDLDSYPAWADGVIETEVVATNDDDSPHRGRFRIDAKVAEIGYLIEYTYEDYDIRWTLIEGDTISQLDGLYELWEDEEGTGVRYTLEVDLDIPVPGFLKKRAAKHILEQGLSSLRHRAEDGG